MPVKFLSDEQVVRYHADPIPEQLARFFCLSLQDVQFLADYRRSHTRLGCAVQLGSFWEKSSRKGKESRIGVAGPAIFEASQSSCA